MEDPDCQDDGEKSAARLRLKRIRSKGIRDKLKGATDYRVRRCNPERGSNSTDFLEASNASSKRFIGNTFATVLHAASRKPIIATASRTRVYDIAKRK